MESEIANNMSAVREGWSEEERRVRKDLAGAMQLQLQALVVLSEFNVVDERVKRTIAIASAC